VSAAATRAAHEAHGTALRLRAIGVVHSTLRTRAEAPRQGDEAPIEAIDGTPVVDLNPVLRLGRIPRRRRTTELLE
jgi:tRNA (Thr-GGU) A37 N-methylase